MTEAADGAKKKIPELRLHAPEQTPRASLKSFVEGHQGGGRFGPLDFSSIIVFPGEVPTDRTHRRWAGGGYRVQQAV